MGLRPISKFVTATALAFAAFAAVPAAQAQTTNFESAFDRELGTQVRTPETFQAVYDTSLERRIAQVADGDLGRIGVAAIDLSTGQQISVLGDQRFPLASTSKIAIAATFLEMVEQRKYSLSSELPLLIPVSSAKYSSRIAPKRQGNYMPAIDLIEIMITRSSNSATDALLDAVGGPGAVNDWMRRNGISDFSIDRDIATLVRDDGEYDPAQHIDGRDSATPAAMVKLLKGLYQGDFLNASNRRVIIGAMERCRTGKRRIPAMMPSNVLVAHKTGSLNNTSSDVGVLTAPDGRKIAVAIYVTGQGSRAAREARIASIARAVYDGYQGGSRRVWTSTGSGGN